MVLVIGNTKRIGYTLTPKTVRTQNFMNSFMQMVLTSEDHVLCAQFIKYFFGLPSLVG